MKEVVKIVITPKGFRFIYSDKHRDLLEAGKSEVRRASHVEPVTVKVHYGFGMRQMWQADMAPCGGPKLEPCRTRAEALAAEAAWLLRHGVPEPEPKVSGRRRQFRIWPDGFKTPWSKEYIHEPSHIILSRGYGEGD